MAFYKSKPVIVQAIKLDKDNVELVAKWCGGTQVEEIDVVDETNRMVGLNVPTLDGVKRVSEGDYIVKDDKETVYPCKADIFETLYEKISI